MIYNDNYFLCKRSVFFYYILNKKLPDDLIEQIIFHLIQKDKNLIIITEEIKNKSLVQKEKDNTYIKSWNLVNYQLNKLKRETALIISEKYKLIPFLKEHNKCCKCCQCIYHIDYPRFVYLYSKTKTKKRGYNSKLDNEWLLFLFFILKTRCSPDKLLEEYNHIIDKEYYGLTSKYDYNNLNKRLIIDPVITEKYQCIELKRIWKKHLLLNNE